MQKLPCLDKRKEILPMDAKILYNNDTDYAELLKKNSIKVGENAMWKLVNGRLTQATDASRTKFRTNISKTILEELHTVALENDTHVNYLLETGLQSVLAQGLITFNKELRPKDRVQYKTTYDKELLESVKEFARSHHLFINDVIEYSVNYMDIKKSKNSSYKHRIE